MKRRLFLTSAGLIPETRQAFLDILNKPPSELKVAFIPTAADPEEDKWFVDSAKKELKELGFNFFEVDLKNDPNLIRKNLKECDIFYLNGGNTFYLLDWVRKSGLDRYLGKLLDQGKIYIGASAGGILVGPDISLAGWDPSWDKNLPNLQDFTGLNFVPFAISPHFEESDRELLERKSKEVNYPIIALTDKQAVLVEGNKWQVVGQGEKIVFQK